MDDCGNFMEFMFFYYFRFFLCGVDSLRNLNRRIDFCVSEIMKFTMKLVRYFKFRVVIISCIKFVMIVECSILVRRSIVTIKSDRIFNRL